MWATRANHFNVGLPQGFVRLGSNHHKILVYLHENGEGTHANFVDELKLTDEIVSNCIVRLRQHKYIKRIGKLDGYEFNCRTQAVYALPWNDGLLKKRYEAPKKTSTDRMRKHRERLKLAKTSIPAVASVFAYAETL